MHYNQQQPQQQQQNGEGQMTEANVPQASHVRVASANLNGGSSSYLHGAQVATHHSHHQLVSAGGSGVAVEAARKISHLKKTAAMQSNAHISAVKKQLSQGDIAGFVSQQKQMQRVSTRQAGIKVSTATHNQYQSTSPEPQFCSNNGLNQEQAHKVINYQRSAAIKHINASQQAFANYGKSPRQHPQNSVAQSSYLSGSAAQSQQILLQKRASPPSGVTASTAGAPAMQQQAALSTNAAAGSNNARKQVKLVSQGANAASSSVLNLVRGTRGSNSPMNHLQGGQQTKSGVLGTSNQQVSNSGATVSQKIKFLLRGKEGGEQTAASRQLAMKISRQKSPKFVKDTSENNTQETFGVVDDQSKENKQMNFQLGPTRRSVDPAQESPSIGDEIASGHPHLHPNISSNNLRGPINLAGNSSEMQPTFAGISSPTLPQGHLQQNPPNQGFQTKQFSTNLRYQVSSALTPSAAGAGSQSTSQAYVQAPTVSQKSAMAVAKKSQRSNDKSPPVHIHYHNHIQVINSSDLQGSNLIVAATPSKSPKQMQNVPVDSLQKPRISRQPSQTNINGAPSRTVKAFESGGNHAAQTSAIKRFTVKQATAGASISGVPKFSLKGCKNGTITPRLATNAQIQQKSTPNLKGGNLQVTTKQSINKMPAHNVSPAGKAALALLGQGAKSQADLGFADRLNSKLLAAQQQDGSHGAGAPPAIAELNTLTDSVDGSKVTSEALKQLQPVQSVTPSKLTSRVAIASKKQQTTSVPPLKSHQEKLDQQSKEGGNIQVHAQVSTSSSKQPHNTGRVSHRMKQPKRSQQQNSSDVNVYMQTASQKSSVGNCSKVRQPVLSSSGASSNSLLSLGKNGGGQTNKSANSILINELSKYVNIKQMGNQKRFQPVGFKTRKSAHTQHSKKQAEQADGQGQGHDQQEIMDNLRHFLQFLERKKIINITEVVQDRAKMNNLMQEIMKIDFKDFKKMTQSSKKVRGSSGSESNGSQSRAAARRRQGTPVNVKTSSQAQSSQPAEQPISTQISNYNYNYQGAEVQNAPQLIQAAGVTPREQAQHQTNMNEIFYDINAPQCASAEHNIIDSEKSPAQQSAVVRYRADSEDSSHANLPIHHLGLNQHHHQSNLAQKEANLHKNSASGVPSQLTSSRVQNFISNQSSQIGTDASLTTGTQATAQAQNQHQVAHGFHSQSTNQSGMQHTQHNYLSGNHHASDSSNGGGANMQKKFGDQLTKFSNATATSRNKIGHSGGVSCATSNNTVKAGRSQASHQQQMTSSNEQFGTSNAGQYVNPHHMQPSQKYANYKAVAVSQQTKTSTKTHRKGGSADPASEPSSKKHFLKSGGLWNLANQRSGGDSEGNQGGHQRRASEGQIIHHHRGRGCSDSSANKGEKDGQKHARDNRRYKSRGGSADQGKQREILRLSRGSSVKRTAKEIVDYIVIDEDRFRVNDNIMKERERIIRYNNLYLKKYKHIPPTTQDFYEFVELIGKGAFGQVTLAIHKLTGRQVAIKAINKSYMQDLYSKQKVMQEVYILKKIRHSNIIRLFEVFESPKHFLLVMEYADGGDLLQFVKKRQYLDEEMARRIFKQVVHGIAHCHCRSVLHRDIKLDNILMDNELSIKICDFGVSRLITKNQSIQEQCGTPAYLAPEIIADRGYRGYYVDLWSLGVLLYAMLQGTVPFKAKSLEGLHAIIMTGKLNFPVQISDQALHLITSLLKVEPEERISIPNILKHPWLRNINEFSLDDDDDDHDFEMGISFRRQECNFNPLSMMGLGDGGAGLQNTNRAQRLNPEAQCEPAEVTQDSNEENLLTEQETNPMQQIGNINVINIENLFHEIGEPAQESPVENGANGKLNYDNYCAVTQDFGTHRIDEEALKVLEGFGYPRKLVIDSLHNGELNHATTCYNLLVTQ